MLPAPIFSQAMEELALAIAPSLQEIYIAINATEHDSKVSWESMPSSDFSCRPGYFIGLRYGDPPLDENFVPSRSSSVSVPKFSRIPPAFDSRQTWPERVGESVNQGLCGLCWAIALAGVLSDRFAIGNEGNHSVGDLSPLDLQTCAQRSPSCATSPPLFEISEHLVKVGVAKSSCLSFQGVLGSSCQAECNDGGRLTRCKSVRLLFCTQTQFRYRAESVHHVGIETSDSFERCWQIMREIHKNGPVLASMNIYIDFLIYKTGQGFLQVTDIHCTSCERASSLFLGVYSKTQEHQRYLGKHSVKIIGWGSEHGEPYWLIQNSWGVLHGEAGLARIRRGTNECGIESEVLAPIPNFLDFIDFDYSLKLKLYLESSKLNASRFNTSNVGESL